MQNVDLVEDYLNKRLNLKKIAHTGYVHWILVYR